MEHSKFITVTCTQMKQVNKVSFLYNSTQKKWSFPLKISSVNVAKSEEMINGQLNILCSEIVFLAEVWI